MASADDPFSLQRRVVELFEENQGAIVRVKAAYDSRNPAELPQVIIGSGFFVSREGHVLTNASVALNPDRVWVVHNGIDYAAELIGHDSATNVALLKVAAIPARGFSYLALSDSPALPERGTMVVRIGAPLELDPSPSFGLVSGLEARFGQHIFPCTLVRTTISAGPGDGGAAYLDLNGRLLGIQVGSLVEISSTYVLPARAIRRVRDDLLFSGEVKEAWIGFEVAEEMSVAEGKSIVLRQILPDTPAAEVGMQPDDRLVQIGGYNIHTLDDLRNAMFYTRVGEYVTVRVQRGQEDVDFNLRLIERPQPERSPVGLIKPPPGAQPASSTQPPPTAAEAPRQAPAAAPKRP